MDGENNNTNKITKVVIPAAGWGTRFLPATKAMPKEMLPIIDKPIIQYVVEEAVASGIEDVILITGWQKRAIEDHFDRSTELEKFWNHRAKIKLLTLSKKSLVWQIFCTSAKKAIIMATLCLYLPPKLLLVIKILQ